MYHGILYQNVVNEGGKCGYTVLIDVSRKLHHCVFSLLELYFAHKNGLYLFFAMSRLASMQGQTNKLTSSGEKRRRNRQSGLLVGMGMQSLIG